MGRVVRGWLIVVLVLAAAALTASIHTRADSKPGGRVRLRLDADRHVFVVDRNGERRLVSLGDGPPTDAAAGAVQRLLIEALGTRSFEAGGARDDAVLEISAEEHSSWWDVHWLMTRGSHPELRVTTFEWHLTGTGRRLTWLDQTDELLAGTPMEDVIEVRVDLGRPDTGVLYVYEDRLAPFMVGLGDGPGEERPRRIVTTFFDPRWQGSLLMEVRAEAADELADGFVRFAFTVTDEVRGSPDRLLFGAAFDILATLQQLEPDGVFMNVVSR